MLFKLTLILKKEAFEKLIDCIAEGKFAAGIGEKNRVESIEQHVTIINHHYHVNPLDGVRKEKSGSKKGCKC